MSTTIRNILWPTDFSTFSLSAVDTALSLCRVFDAKLHVLHVAPVYVPDARLALEIGHDMPPAIDLSEMQQMMEKWLVRNLPTGQPASQKAVAGLDWYDICEYARHNSIDLIVLATHGRTGLKHVLLGSVAERVVRHASCAVMVVKSTPGANRP